MTDALQLTVLITALHPTRTERWLRKAAQWCWGDGDRPVLIDRLGDWLADAEVRSIHRRARRRHHG